MDFLGAMPFFKDLPLISLIFKCRV